MDQLKPKRKKQKRSLKQNLIWTSGGMEGSFDCAKVNLWAAQRRAEECIDMMKATHSSPEDFETLLALNSKLRIAKLDADIIMREFAAVLADLGEFTSEFLRIQEKGK
jgi:hypothetical protein